MAENRLTTYRISEGARELSISAEWLSDRNGHRYYTEEDIERMRKGRREGYRRSTRG